MGWNDSLREGFTNLERFQAVVTSSKFKIGNIPEQDNQGIQLELGFRVSAVELPPNAEVPENYNLWYSIGDKNGKAWDLADNEGSALWPKFQTPDGKTPGFVKTSKIGLLIARLVELNAPMISSGYEPHQAAAYLNLNAIWQMETVQYPGLNDSDVTRPVQILGVANVGAVQAQAQPVATMAAPASNGAVAVATPPPPPQMAAPPTAVAYRDWNAHWGPNSDAWKNYIRSIAAGKGVEEAATIIFNDANLRADSDLMVAVQDRSFFAWCEASNFMRVTDGLLV